MDFVTLPGANITLAEGQAEYQTITGVYRERTPSIHAASGEEYNSGPSIEVGFELTFEEKIALMQGRKLHLRVLGGGFPPVALWVE